MVRLNKCLALLLVLLISLNPALSSCGFLLEAFSSDESQDSESHAESESDTESERDTEAGTDTDDTAKTDILYADRKMNYNIVYASSENPDVKAAADTLYNKLFNYIDAKSFYGSDSEIRKGELPEILIGDTDREESRAVSESLEENTYSIKRVNGQIVIVADKPWMLTDAVEAFMEKIEFSKDKKTATVSADIDVTEALDGNSRDRWTLVFPAYEGGILSATSYRSNYGLTTMTGTTSKNYSVICAYETCIEEFSAYVAKLRASGYTVNEVSSTDGILSYWVSGNGSRMYIYLSKNADEARFIVDNGDSVSAEDFSYSYGKQSGDTTVLYQYGFTMSDHGKNIFEYYKVTDESGVETKVFNTETSNCGELLIFKLADNSVMIIDGASHYMTPDEAMAGLDEFLHEITETPAGEKVRISNWLMTHSHRDHFSGFARFLNVYHENYEVERVSFNFNYIDSLMPEFFNNYFRKWYPDAVFHRPHTGETLTLADITIDILYTYEDSISAETGALLLDKMPQLWGGNPAIDQNNQSIAARITFDGKTFFLTGDIAYVAQDALLTNYSAQELKMDILSVSHHGLNPLEQLYDVVKPSVTLCSQKKEAAPTLNSLAIKAYNSYVENTEGGLDSIYFAGNCTAGVSVGEDGELTVETRDIVGGIWDGKDIYGQTETIPAH